MANGLGAARRVARSHPYCAYVSRTLHSFWPRAVRSRLRTCLSCSVAVVRAPTARLHARARTDAALLEGALTAWLPEMRASDDHAASSNAFSSVPSVPGVATSPPTAARASSASKEVTPPADRASRVSKELLTSAWHGQHTLASERCPYVLVQSVQLVGILLLVRRPPTARYAPARRSACWLPALRYCCRECDAEHEGGAGLGCHTCPRPLGARTPLTSLSLFACPLHAPSFPTHLCRPLPACPPACRPPSRCGRAETTPPTARRCAPAQSARARLASSATRCASHRPSAGVVLREQAAADVLCLRALAGACPAASPPLLPLCARAWKSGR